MYFTNAQIQYLVLALLGGLILALIVIVGYFSFRLSIFPPKSEEKIKAETHEFNDGIRESNNRVPLFVVLLGLTILAWGVFYTIAVATGLIGGIYEQP